MTFEDAWLLYPKKVAKLDAQKAWNKLRPDQQWAVMQALPIHARYWDAAGTAKEYLPHFATWIRGERWTDELAMPQARSVVEAWWASDEGIHRKALELGIAPRPGESWPNLKARINAEIQRRQAA